MIGRILVLAGGMTGAAGLSQYPEFSQQYMQRLAGAVDELSRFVAAFDSDAADLDLSREEALVQLAQGGEIGAKRAETVNQTIARHRRLSGDFEALGQAGPFTRAYNARRLTDPEIAEAAWQDFKPALPFTFEGGVFAGVGFISGMLLIALVWAVILMPFRRRDDNPPSGPRNQPDQPA